MAGTNIFNGNIQLYEGGNSCTVQSDSGLVVFTGTTMYVGSLAGIHTNYFTGPGNHLLIGPILNSTNGSPISLTKSGTGTLTLLAANTYGNGTTLGGGTMIVDGSLPAGAFNITSGTTLRGNGVINCPVTLPSGATLAPGDGVGTLTVNNNVTLQPGSTTRVALDKSVPANSQLYVTGALAYGGSLIVTNLIGTLWAGDTFQIFGAPNPTGAFASTNFPPLPNGFLWEWDPASGTLSIFSTIALNPINPSTTVSGNALSLSLPSDHIGWHLESNSADIADPNSWIAVPGSSLTNQISIPIDSSNAHVFFRLTFP